MPAVGCGRRMAPKRLPSHVPVRRRIVRIVRWRVRRWEEEAAGGEAGGSSRRNRVRPRSLGGV